MSRVVVEQGDLHVELVPTTAAPVRLVIEGEYDSFTRRPWLHRPTLSEYLARLNLLGDSPPLKPRRITVIDVD